GGQFLLGGFELILAGGAVAGQLLEARGIGRLQLAQLLLQALAALFEVLQLAVGVALGLRDQGQVLLDARQRAAHLVARGGRVAHLGLGGRQAGLGVLGQRAGFLGARGARGEVVLGLGDLFGAVRLLG